MKISDRMQQEENKYRGHAMDPTIAGLLIRPVTSGDVTTLPT